MTLPRVLTVMLFGAGVLLPPVGAPKAVLPAPIYGYRLAMSGEQVLVVDTDLIPSKDDTVPGLIRIFSQNAAHVWTERGQIVAPAEDIGSAFGVALSADDQTLLVGVRRSSGSNGVVRVYSRGATGSWVLSASIAAPEGQSGFGTGLLLHGSSAFITATRGALFRSQRDAAGHWSTATAIPLRNDATDPMVDRLGTAMAASGDWLVLGGPGNPGESGKLIFLHRTASGEWLQQGGAVRVPGATALGSAMQFSGNTLVVGAPGAPGKVVQFDLHGDSAWSVTTTYQTPRGNGDNFGASLAIVGTELWVSAPMDNDEIGSVWRLSRTTTGWEKPRPLAIDSVDAPGRLGSPMVAGPGVVVIGATRDGVSPPKGIGAVALPGLDEKPGKVYFLVSADGSEWKVTHRAASPPLVSYAAVTGAEVQCAADGKAGAFGCRNTTLLSFLPISALGGYRGTHLSGMWGWTDSVSGRDYALVGRTDATAFVDVTDPLHPRYLGDLPRTKGTTTSNWREIKTYRHYALIVSDGAGPHGMQVFDLTRLRDVTTPRHFTEDAHYPLVGPVHDIAVNEASGFAYLVGANRTGETCAGGLHMVDLREPLHPAFTGCFNDPGTGRAGAGFTHDVQCVRYHGPDARYTGHEVCMAANETHVSIQDVTDKKQPKVIAHVTYPNLGYAHQGWFSDDQRYWFFDDELDEEGKLGRSAEGTRTLVWDVGKLDDPVMAKEYIGATRAIDHNQFVKGNRLYQSNYTAGLRILDISNPLALHEVGHFDTHPLDDSTVFAGSWSNYPWFRNGAIGVVSMAEGLFLIRDRTRPE